MPKAEMRITPSKIVAYTFHVEEGDLKRTYHFNVSNDFVHRVGFRDDGGNEVYLANFDLRAINAIIEKMGWKLKSVEEVKG